jgi:signal transduction histidine kinase/ligand-binding sensor domain-containing protein
MRGKALIVCFIYIFSFGIEQVYSQTIIPRFEHLGVNDGLPHSSVYSITQDKKGFMWFGTPDGLCRYDGEVPLGFKYAAVDTGDIINNFVRGRILEDYAGNIWYSNESGIYKWDVYKEKVVKVKAFKKNEFANTGFIAVALDENGSLWLFNVTNGIFEFNIFSGKFAQYMLPVQVNGTVLNTYNTVDTEDNIWIRVVPGNDHYIVFNKISHLYSAQLAGNPPHAIFFSKEKEIRAFDDSLVYKDLKDHRSYTVIKRIGNKKVAFHSFDGVRDNYGRLWLTARGNGLFYYDERRDHFREFHHDNSKLKSLPFDLTTCLFIDRGQNLWIGIDGGGVAKLDLKQPKFNLFPLSEGDYPVLNDYFTKCFFEDEKGRIWFGSHTNGLNILDPENNTLINYHHDKGNPLSLPGNMVGSILKDNAGNIWIGSSGGISLFDEKKGSFKDITLNQLPELHPELNIFVYKMIQMHDGDLLAATLSGLVRVAKKKGSDKYEGSFFTTDPALRTISTDVAEMPGGTIYATAPALGLYELKPQGTTYILSNIFLSGTDLRSVRLDEKNAGWLWVSTGIGLVHFDTKTGKHRVWNENDGLANSYVYGSLEDENGLWISTNGGLSHLNSKNRRFDNYTYQHGLQSNEFNTQAFYKGPTGIFYFGGIKGFNWFRPGPMNSLHTKPQAAITKIKIGEKVFVKDSSFVTDHTITVKHHQNEFNFWFSALDYTRPEANKIQYILEGWDNGWITTFEKSVRYGHLLPGRYTFRMKVSNADGIWSEEEKIYLIIQAPFWRQTWFRAAAILFLFLIVIIVTNSITHQKAKRKLQLLEKQIAIDTERDRISADMHDEIGSGITRIALLSELIQTQEKEVKEVKNDVLIIGMSARRLVQTMSEIIWALSPHNDSLENLLAYIREQSQQYFEPLEVQFSICFPDVSPDIKLSNAQRRNLYLVTKEALNNALKHSGATAINLKLEIINGVNYFMVTDNGSGIHQKKNKPGSNGIRNMKKRMEDIGGSIQWMQLERGTTVSYWFSA